MYRAFSFNKHLFLNLKPDFVVVIFRVCCLTNPMHLRIYIVRFNGYIRRHTKIL